MPISDLLPPLAVLKGSPSIDPQPNELLRAYCQQLRAQFPVNKKILLVQLPQGNLQSFAPEISRKRGYYAFPPTGLQCLYEALSHRDLDVRILDLNLELLKSARTSDNFDVKRWAAPLERTLESLDPYIVGFTSMFDSSIAALLQAMQLVGQRGRSVVLSGGVIATYEAENLLNRGLCHFVVLREGENRLNYLLDHLTDENQETLASSGICFRFGGRQQETTGEANDVFFRNDMVKSYDLVPIEEYYEHGSLNPFSRMARQPFAAIQINRGCRAECGFCAVRGYMGKGVRERPVEAVLREIEYLVTKRNVRHFEWLDDDLLFYRRDLVRLLKGIIESNWPLTWSASNGLIAGSLDAELLDLMRDSGCIGFRIGVESGNAEMLRKVKKPGTLPAFRRVARLLQNYPEIFVGANFIIGFPGETFALMMDSFRFSLELQLDWSGFTTCQAVRGATMFEAFEEVFDTQMRTSGATIQNYIPVRNAGTGRIATASDVRQGLDVFSISAEHVPTPEQVKEIWFTFNLVGNYIFNKNLLPGGSPKKFITWVEMAQIPYPTNPYMSLFLGLAHRVGGDAQMAEVYQLQAIAFSQDAYWRERFCNFQLEPLLAEFPRSPETTFASINKLRESVARFFPRPASQLAVTGDKIS